MNGGTTNEYRVTLLGRLAADPELRYTPTGIPVTRVTLAVQRPYKQNGEYGVDFNPASPGVRLRSLWPSGLAKEIAWRSMGGWKPGPMKTGKGIVERRMRLSWNGSPQSIGKKERKPTRLREKGNQSKSQMRIFLSEEALVAPGRWEAVRDKLDHKAEFRRELVNSVLFMTMLLGTVYLLAINLT